MNEVKNYISNMTVLFVDDEDGVRESFEILLNMWAKKVYTAPNGKEGLIEYKKYKPDIVVTDIKMPIMSGLEMVGEMKKIDPDLPVIITTAHQEPELLLKAIDHQVDAYIVKPILKKELKKRLEGISKILTLEKELSKLQELNKLYLDASGAFMMALDTEANITMINKSGAKILGQSQEELFGKNWFDINVIPEEKVKEVVSYFNDLILDKIEEPKREYINTVYSKDGSSYTLLWSNTLLRENNRVVGVFASALDITELDNAQKKLKEQSYMDELTNIYNRKFYYKKISELLSIYERYKTPFSVLMYDIDDFKNINDTYGHAVGDDVLIEMSRLIESHIRTSDYHCRIGGEEFIILFSEIDLSRAKVVAEKIRKSVAEDLKTIQNQKITISIGITEVGQNDDKETIFKRVDDLLYEAKNAGKNIVVF